MSVSIVVPVLNEADLLGQFLAHVRERAPAAEIIVVDGGSTDGSRAIAERAAQIVIDAPRGRARQMNAGAEIARGDVLWFLHADLQLPCHAVDEIESALRDPHFVGGCFRLRFASRAVVYRISDSLGNVGVDVFGIALGDHGIFCRRAAFRKVGGYRDVPILEDAELYRALRRVGRMTQLRAQISCSPRTFERHGPWRTTALYFSILVLYVCGVPIRTLHRIYSWR